VALLAAQCSEEPKGLKTPQDKISYSIGTMVAKNIKKQGVEVDMNFLVKGMKDEFAGKLLLSEQDLEATMKELQTQLLQKQVASMVKLSGENKKAGEEFQEAYKKKEGAVTLPSGLQYKVLKKGEGKKPGPNDLVEVHYRGTLIDGKEFDSSLRAGKPITIKSGDVIPGWSEALKLMPLGSKWEIVVPPKLAYGEQGMGNIIGPNATLVFELELLSVKEAKKEEKKKEEKKKEEKKEKKEKEKKKKTE
jgi:FKBP-type peptidyl-prolyl cis-trans isomerase